MAAEILGIVKRETANVKRPFKFEARAFSAIGNRESAMARDYTSLAFVKRETPFSSSACQPLSACCAWRLVNLLTC
jgi:hypothetical protein